VKIKPTPESAEVAAVRHQYDCEAYGLRTEIARLRNQLHEDGVTSTMYAALVLSFTLGLAIGVVLYWAVGP